MSDVAAAREVRIGSITLHDVVAAEADRIIGHWLSAPSSRGRYVCTPNVDFVVRAGRDAEFRSAIEDADLRVPDGMWIIYASRIAGRPLRGTVTGRLLLPRLATYCRDRGLVISLLGAGPDVAATAAQKLSLSIPRLIVRHAISPPMNFEVGGSHDMEYVAELAANPPAILFVALGAPKQEVWMQRHAADLPGVVMIGIGAGLDVIAGRFREAPAWMTKIGVEWAFRLVQEPRRLARRYLVDDPRILIWAALTRLGIYR